MASIFSKIIAGQIPCYKIAETENCFAFLDINPLAKGHVLVVPKKEVDYYFDLEDAILKEINVLAKQISNAIEKAVPCKRIGVAIIGLEVPHAHMHLIPINNVSDIDFSRPKLRISSEEMEQISQSIRENI